jgi:hypothetical protein
MSLKTRELINSQPRKSLSAIQMSDPSSALLLEFSDLRIHPISTEYWASVCNLSVWKTFFYIKILEVFKF